MSSKLIYIICNQQVIKNREIFFNAVRHLSSVENKCPSRTACRQVRNIAC